MSGLVIGALLVLATCFGVSTALSLATAAATPWLRLRLAGRDAARRADGLLVLALLPSAAGLAVALGIALPAFVAHEPAGVAERPGPVLLALAAAGAALAALRIGAALLAQWRTARLVSAWIREGTPLTDLPVPALRLRGPGPMAALSGVLRPRLLLSGRLLDTLSPEELRAVVAHEQAHVAARENLKRLLLQAAPDVLALLPAGAALRADFEEAAEVAADATACARVAPLALARTLLKVAAVAPAESDPPLAAAALHRPGLIETRVRALVARSEQAAPERARKASGLHLVALLLAPGLLAAASGWLPAAHGLLERLVHLLS